MKDINMKKLLRGLVNEERIPGIDVTKDVNKTSKKYNDEYHKEVETKMKGYEDGIMGDDEELDNKVNATDTQKEYHDEMETLNGQEMIKYSQEPSDRFRERAEMALKGDSKMGNKIYTGKHNPETGEGNGNTEPVWGASDEKFGEKLVDRVRSSNKKRKEATPDLIQMGDDIEIKGKGADSRQGSIKESVNEDLMADPNYTHFAIHKPSQKILNGWNYSDIENDELKSAKQEYFYEDLVDYTESGIKKSEILITTRKNMEKRGIDPTIASNWYQVYNKNIQESKTSMKRLKFKKSFNGVETALKLIPENYKVDDKVFEMTDGNETYKIRWEGNVNEGEAVVLESENKKLIQENREKVMKLINYDSKKTLGIRKAKERVTENYMFNDFMKKAKNMIKEEDKK